MRDLVEAQGEDSYESLENRFYCDYIMNFFVDSYEANKHLGIESSVTVIVDNFLFLNAKNSYWNRKEIKIMINSIILPNIHNFDYPLDKTIIFMNLVGFRQEDVQRLEKKKKIKMEIGINGLCPVNDKKFTEVLNETPEVSVQGSETEKADKLTIEKPIKKKTTTPFTQNQLYRGWKYVIGRAKIMYFMCGQFPPFSNEKYWFPYVKNVEGTHTAGAWSQKVSEMKASFKTSGLDADDMEFVKLMLKSLNEKNPKKTVNKKIVGVTKQDLELQNPPTTKDSLRQEWKAKTEEAEVELASLKQQVKEVEERLLLLGKEGKAIQKIEKYEAKMKEVDKKKKKK